MWHCMVLVPEQSYRVLAGYDHTLPANKNCKLDSVSKGSGNMSILTAIVFMSWVKLALTVAVVKSKSGAVWI